MADMRRKYTTKRKLEHLEEAGETLLRFIDALRESESKRLKQFLYLIRSNSPELREIQSQISHPSDDGDEEQPPFQTRNLRCVLDVRRLADSPVHRVPAKPWTTVTDDDDLVSHLISLWLTWIYPFFHRLDKDAFLRDMRAENLQCRFYSRFLYYSDYAEVFTVPHDTLTRGDHFYEEARRLLGRGGRGDSPDYSRTPGFVYSDGSDGQRPVRLDVSGSSHSNGRRVCGKPSTRQEPDVTVENVVNRSLWGTFNLASTAMVSLMKHINVKPPQRPRIPVTHGDVAYSTAEHLVAPSQMIGFVDSIYKQLQEYHAHLPLCLSAEVATVPHILESSYVLPHHRYLILDFYGLSVRSPSTYPPPPMHESSACRRRARWRRCCEFIATSGASTEWCRRRSSGAASACLLFMESPDSAENRNAFIELCIIAQAFSRRFPQPRDFYE
ncbi:hypothetical protein AnigIFM59636_011983 [Aspergillus niger]|nr:hypothetical protein AnigIFM59636_011983 [Aspergillus niger]